MEDVVHTEYGTKFYEEPDVEWPTYFVYRGEQLIGGVWQSRWSRKWLVTLGYSPRVWHKNTIAEAFQLVITRG